MASKSVIVVACKGTLLVWQTGKTQIIMRIRAVGLERFPIAYTICGFVKIEIFDRFTRVRRLIGIVVVCLWLHFLAAKWL